MKTSTRDMYRKGSQFVSETNWFAYVPFVLERGGIGGWSSLTFWNIKCSKIIKIIFTYSTVQIYV